MSHDGKSTSAGSWAVPSWDVLFAGRKTELTKEQEEPYERQTASQESRDETVHMIAEQGQNAMAADIQEAVQEKMPFLPNAPTPAHLAPSSSRLEDSSAFPAIIRKSRDGGHGRAQSSVSQPHVAVSSTGTAEATEPVHSVVVDGIEGPTLPAESLQPRSVIASTTHSASGTLQRAGHMDDGRIYLSRERPDLLPTYSDTPAGQWADAAPSSSLGKEATSMQADLWDSLTSIFGTSSRPGDDVAVNRDEPKDQILGAVSRLQTLLGEGTKVADWKKDHEKEINSALSQGDGKVAMSSEGASSDGHSHVDDSGLRHQPTYLSPRLPIVFAHGLFGFDQFSLAPAAWKDALPGLSFTYWRGISDTLERRGVETLIAKVPMSASIKERAESLRDLIEERFPHREVNVLAHSMGGLDGRYLISQLESTFTVRSLTTIATPHRGSYFADYMLDRVIGKERLPTLLGLVEKAGLPGGGRAFADLTTYAMADFNERVPDRDEVVYMSWGAAHQPSLFHEFRFAWGLVKEKEGPNDGLVSIESSKWGEYRGTLTASHLEVIGWFNQLATLASGISTKEKPFDPKTLYLTICEDLALRGL